MISLSKVSKTYELEGEELTVLKNVTFTIKRGEFVAIAGPSGSGKSTLMHIIGLLDKPSDGAVLINNVDVSTLSDDDISMMRNEFVGFVFQQFNLINKLSIIENVMLPTIYTRKILDFEPRERAMELLTRFGIGEKADTFPNKISGGQQQRVAIARALIMKPELILADEPTGNLDSKTGDTILKLLEELNKKDKITIIVVTHEADVARRANRKIKVVDGEIAQ
ncbi:ABC transporter ATP-binding protein [Candidatus Roizmanbacteria bacterium RIFCSPHIGHO2_02_FULL_40_13b]|uniref:ABC transporter ATP-binding protein n=1 Tax=Candidatus Roizmanbacteria bacterium RIFCSPHIGHO2_01_FULL_39_24 TaxID=1802032 RepID=A0A1F7GJX1_9BACT|nr:MAG: ABC transporter ATP-binding protein [Candidatus Roizmanbacteria bacterium RIFCSPHIGHO2_01_FULL_39_24]OGK26261.1 MAG: ABC transporter ATP-binding protein [Candidatus Roizmanbacteria bacterium RIFCSPHIGHO2_02_FULL_40_13b]OGK48896.1 MAG: ABC transporter ATP-binding protein [Candidatus Roizmanbacteria bacterium RIFCSPLOWO2_01_FULL_40_32]OGK57563.1 MAG: ABC transporter ATP-binding protein [Candidatus Roizmanbacteria bacterium RIFCSPLOWO2_02_FULL_39_8]